jgi:N-acetylglutamate synthase-like GNAT family acetyltransferase
MSEIISPRYHIRGAKKDDAKSILDLIADEVHAGRMLPRQLGEVQRSVGNWQVALVNKRIVGCVSLVFYNDKLCELRSLAVSSEYRGNGLGSELVASIIELAREKVFARVITLTRSTHLFEQLGFKQDLILNFPEKVWRDCYPCPFRHQCDEVALTYELNRKENR